VAEHESDAGKVIRVIGTDSNNRDLRSQVDDGTGVDGLLVPIHAQSDFPYGVILPDGVTINTRTSAIDPLTKFKSTEAHGLTSGPSATLDIVSGDTPADLTIGSEYYIGVVDDFNIQLHQSELDAIYGINPIKLQSITGTQNDSVKLTDSRQAQLQTVLAFGAQPSILIDSPNEVNFYQADINTPLPSPLKEGVVYYVNDLDLYTLQVYATRIDAQNSTNPILLSGNNATFKIGIRKAITPQTKLTFSSAPGFSAGDTVEAYTSGGVLPQPLVVNQSYYVGTVDGDPLSITLHLSYADAIAKTNSVNFVTAGSGNFSIAKLIPATAIAGISNNIGTTGFTLPTATGAGAVVQAQVVGPVTSATVISPGAGYITASATFLDTGGYKYNSTPSVLVSGGSPATQATAHAVLSTDPATGFQYVSSVVMDSLGSGYDPSNPPKIIFNGGLGADSFEAVATPTISGGQVTAITLSPVGNGASATVSVNTVSTLVNGVILTSSGADYLYPPRITISGPQGAQFAGVLNGTTLTVSSISFGTIRAGAVITGTGVFAGTIVSAFLTGTGGTGTYTVSHNYTSSVTVPVITQAGTQATASCGITTSFVKSCKVIQGGSGYTASPAIFFSGGQGTGAIAIANINQSGAVDTVSMVAQGTGYTSAPATTVKASTGFFVQFSSSGTMPLPLEQGNSYLAEGPSSANTFTVQNSDHSEVNITSTGSGNFYLVISRTFSVGFTNKWVGDFAGIADGSSVALQTDYQLPITSPATSPGSTVVIQKISDSEIYLYSASVLLTVIEIGFGQAYLSYNLNVTPAVYENRIQLDSSAYLSEGQVVTFTSSGTLPDPLSTSYEYTIYSITGNGIVVWRGGSIVNFTSLGIGQLVLNVVRNFTPVASTSIICLNSIIETGNQLTVRASKDDSLPVPLFAPAQNSPNIYYARRVGAESFELYDTLAHSQNTSSIIGRIEYLTSGDTVSSTFFTDSIKPQTLVKTVSHVEKPVTLGYVSLYAFDYGRSNDMALIGQYHPSETNPKYRRIRIGKPCAWARIIYRVKAPEITSVYDYIPIENARAVIAAVHAVDLEDKDFVEQSQKYWQAAMVYLRNETDNMDGHAMMPPQINNETFGDGSDPVMF
jgi:hypothetical protein